MKQTAFALGGPAPGGRSEAIRHSCHPQELVLTYRRVALRVA